MKTLRPALAAVLACMLPLMVIWGTFPVKTDAQESTVIPVSIAPTSVTVGQPWHQEAGMSVGSPGREIAVLAGTNDNLIIAFVEAESVSGDPVSDVLAAHTATIGTLTDIDRNSRYALQSAQINGVPYGMFSLTYTNRNPGIIEVHIYLAPASTFDTGLASVQGSVVVDRFPVFSRVNGRTLQSFITRQAGPGNVVTDATLPPPLTILAPSPAPTVTPVPTVAATLPATPATPESMATPATPASTTTPVTPAAPVTLATPETPATPVNRATPVTSATPVSRATPEPPVSNVATPAISATPVPVVTAVPATAVAFPTNQPAATPVFATPVVEPATSPDGTLSASPASVAAPAAPLRRPENDVSHYEEVGLSEDGTYASPQFQTEVAWDTRWTVLPETDSAVTSDWMTRTDSVSLSSTIYPEVVVVVSVMSAYDFGMDDWTTALQLRDQRQFPTVLTDMGAIGGVAVLTGEDGDMIYMFDVSTSADGSVFREIEVRSSTPLSPEVLAAVIAGIEMDGEPVFQSITPEELEAALP